MEKLNTHYYDGNLSQRKIELGNILKINISDEEKLKVFHTFKDTNINKLTPQAVLNLNTIISDLQKFGSGKGPNYSMTNDLSADVLLYILIDISNSRPDVTEDIIKQIGIQLDEMSSGMCSEGRTSRLFQLVCAHESVLIPDYEIRKAI